MINLKNNKGITLIVQVLTITVLILILSVVSYSSVSSLEMKKLNNMYADIISIQEKAANYYLKYGEAPVDYAQPLNIVIDSEEVSDEEKANADAILNEQQRNSNDEIGAYYKVDISKLLNLTLNNDQTEEEYYYMNTKTLTTYSSKGVIASGTTYYTMPSNYESVENINVEQYQNEN